MCFRVQSYLRIMIYSTRKIIFPIGVDQPNLHYRKLDQYKDFYILPMMKENELLTCTRMCRERVFIQ